jgi:2-oxoglutarate ferredoxin oxidoreductase subunit beta
LTTGQITPTSQLGFKSKAEPVGKFYPPLNPIRLALAAGATFVARANARDTEHTAFLLEQAIKHKGFSFLEIIQDCIVFNTQVNNRDKLMYKLEKIPQTKKEAMAIAEEYDYNVGAGKIPLGIFWQEQRKTLEDGWPQLQNLMKLKVGWKGLRR